MIQLVGVGKRFGHKLLFDGLSWHIKRGQRIGLLGPNGAGKTTLLRLICGHIEIDGGQIVQGKGLTVGLLDQEQVFEATKTVLEEVRKAGGETETIERELHSLEQRLGDADAETLQRYGELQDRFEAIGGYKAEADAKRVLCGLGFTEPELYEPASKFSGGWRMRIALARLLLSSPDVLLLDEPTNHLDLESLAWLEGHLALYPGAVVAVSHDRYFLNRAVDRIADLGPTGVTIYTGNYDKFLERREADRELLEKRFKLQQDEIAKTERFIERFRFKNTKAAAVQSRVKALEKLERIEIPQDSRGMRGFKFPQPPRTARNVAELRGATKAWGDNVVYEGLDLTIERGRRVALVGVNGAGKSTLLKVLADATPLQSGTLSLGSHVKVGYFGQHQVEELNPAATVLQEMDAVADVETYPMVRGLLGAFLFSGEDVDKQVSVLSGGEKARLALCKLLLNPVALLLMDEPTSHLDLQSRSMLEDALMRYEGTLVVVSHDRYFINAVCDHVLEVDRGAVAWHQGNYDAYVYKQAQLAQAAEETDGLLRTSSGLVEKTDKGSTGGGKNKKREEAEARQRISKATSGLKKELGKLETAIEKLEARMVAIDASLGDPAIYEEKGRAQELTTERVRTDKDLSTAYERWEALEEEEEEAAEAARAG